MDGVMTRGRLYFGNSRDLFAVTIAGRKLYVATNALDTTTIYKSTASLSFDQYIRDKMVAIGVSPAGFDRWWQVQAIHGLSTTTGATKVTYKAPVHVGESLVKSHLNPGPRFDSLQTEALGRIDGHHLMHPRSLVGDGGKISLVRWCSEVLIDSTTRSFFGDDLMDIEPAVVSSFLQFDDLNWQFILPYPSFLAREMAAGRDRVIKALTKYFERPVETRTYTSAFVLSLEKEMRSQGISNEDIAAMLMLTVWAINSNTYKLCFWMMAYILQDRNLLETLRHETRAVADQECSGMARAVEACPKLDAVYYEVLRLATASTSIRTVLSPTMVGGKLLLPGNDVFIPSRQMHFDPAVFGSDCDRFNPTRFLDNALRKSPSYRPFGGGTTYCPGRFLAKREVLTFVALALNRFEMTISDRDGRQQQFPRLETRKPSLGVLAPITGDDISLLICPRQVGVT
ncbi:MAG: hypothetical protein Q9170_006813 [Blastenia crenularia]